jgi:predicted dehydrogenase
VEAVFEQATFLLRGNALYRTDAGFELVCDPRATPLGERDYWGSGHLAQLEDFYRCIQEDRPFFIDGRQGIEAVKLVFGLYESSETGKTVYI